MDEVIKSKVLITGGSGLLALNWAITSRQKFDILLCLHKRKVNIKSTKTVHIDLNTREEITKVLSIEKPKAVIHTVAITSIEECEKNPIQAHHVNVTLTENIAQVCAKLNIKFVYISTDHLFNGESSFSNESSLAKPLNVYAKTKYDAENVLTKICPSALIIRTNFYCWGPSYRLSFSDFIIKNLKSNNKIKLFKDVFYTPTLAETVIKAVEELIHNDHSGVFNIASSERISKYDFGLKIANIFDLNSSLIIKSSLVEQKNLIKRPLDMSLSNKKILEVLSFKISDIDNQINKLKEQKLRGVFNELELI